MNLAVTNTPRPSVNRGIQGHAVVHASFVDFATDATGVGAEAHTAASIAMNRHANERVVPVTSLDGTAKPNAIKDGVGVNFPSSSFLNKFVMPSVSSVTPIKVDNLALQLCNHPERQKVDYVLNGLRAGFRISFRPESVCLKSAKANCPSAHQHPSVIDDYLRKEVMLGRVFGPVAHMPLPNLQVSRFGVIPKKDGAWRLILDLSFPFGHSVNDGINKEEFTLTYSKVSDAIALIIKAGRGALMGKVDIKSAYRIIPVHPSDRHLLGMFWHGSYYVDLTLPFGLRSAPGIFNSLADLFHWILTHNYNVLDLLHYLDDYFTLGPPNSDTCATRLQAIEHASSLIGIPLSPDKCVGPTTCLVFLGIELDSLRMTARLPEDKRAELIKILYEWASKRWCKLKELQSLVGKLSHACAVVPQGRTFVRRLLDLLKGHSSKKSRFIRLNKECKLDIEWWQRFLPTWDGVYFFDLPEWAPVPDLYLSTDASGSHGYGAFYSGEWFNGRWSPAQLAFGIAYKELFPIVVACHVWGTHWRNRRVQFCCDNQSVVAIISSGTSKERPIMQLLRELFLCSARFGFKVSAKHVPGRENGIADALSRFNMQVFLQLAPQAHTMPVVIPPELLARLISPNSNVEQQH